MNNKHKTATRDCVIKTETYKDLSNMLKKMVLSRNNMVHGINHNIEVINNLGYERWCEITNTRYYNRSIVEELTGNG